MKNYIGGKRKIASHLFEKVSLNTTICGNCGNTIEPRAAAAMDHCHYCGQILNDSPRFNEGNQTQFLNLSSCKPEIHTLEFYFEDGFGDPVPGVTVFVVRDEDLNLTSPSFISGTTGSNGILKFKLTDGEYNYFIQHDNPTYYYLGGGGIVTIDGEDFVEDVIIPAHTITFHVKHSGNQANIEGASITVIDYTNNPVGDPLITSDQGTVTIDLEEGGEYDFQVSKEAFVTEYSYFIVEDDETITIELTPDE